MNLANVLITLFGIAAATAYLAAAVRHIAILSQPQPTPKIEAQRADTTLSMPLATIAVACHTVGLFLTLMSNGGLGGSFYEMMSATALVVMLIALPSAKLLPSLIVPLAVTAALCILLNLWFGDHKPLAGLEAATSAHIAFSLVAYGVLCVAAITAAILYASDRGLRKGSNSAWLTRLPPIEAIESLMFRLIGTGWLLLSAGLIIGMSSIDDFFAQHLAHKTTFSILSWLLFGALLMGRARAGWRSQVAIKLTVAAFLLLAVAFLGSKFVLDVLLNRL